MEIGEKKTDGSKEENHPSGENTKLLPTNANAPPAEPAMPELPKVEDHENVRPQRGTAPNRQLHLERGIEISKSYKNGYLIIFSFCTILGPVY